MTHGVFDQNGQITKDSLLKFMDEDEKISTRISDLLNAAAEIWVAEEDKGTPYKEIGNKIKVKLSEITNRPL